MYTQVYNKNVYLLCLFMCIYYITFGILNLIYTELVLHINLKNVFSCHSLYISRAFHSPQPLLPSPAVWRRRLLQVPGSALPFPPIKVAFMDDQSYIAFKNPSLSAQPIVNRKLD